MDHEAIKRLIPQREPILLVDQLTGVNGDVAETSLLIREDNFFLEEDKQMAEVGLIEHIAQSASAFAGYKAIAAGASAPPVGYIGEVRKFRCHKRPSIGDELRTTITLGAELDGVTILTGETRSGGEIVANTQMKIFIKPDQESL